MQDIGRFPLDDVQAPSSYCVNCSESLFEAVVEPFSNSSWYVDVIVPKTCKYCNCRKSNVSQKLLCNSEKWFSGLCSDEVMPLRVFISHDMYWLLDTKMNYRVGDSKVKVHSAFVNNLAGDSANNYGIAKSFWVNFSSIILFNMRKMFEIKNFRACFAFMRFVFDVDSIFSYWFVTSKKYQLSTFPRKYVSDKDVVAFDDGFVSLCKHSLMRALWVLPFVLISYVVALIYYVGPCYFLFYRVYKVYSWFSRFRKLCLWFVGGNDRVEDSPITKDVREIATQTDDIVVDVVETETISVASVSEDDCGNKDVEFIDFNDSKCSVLFDYVCDKVFTSQQNAMEDIVIANDYCLPPRVILDPPTTNDFHVTKKDVVISSIERDCMLRLPGQPEINGSEVRGKTGRGPKKIGPSWSNACCFDTKSTLNNRHAAESRCKVKYDFQPDVGMIKRLLECQNFLLEEWFTPAAIKEARNYFLDLFEAKPKKCAVTKFRETLYDLLTYHEFEDAESFLKFEVINKPGKAPRIVINEGLHRCLSNLLVVVIIEHIVFTNTKGSNIKHVAKNKFMDDLCKNNQRAPLVRGQKEDTVFVEIDQTAFDFSEGYDPTRTDHKGLLQIELAIMQKIVDNLGDIADLRAFHEIFHERFEPSKFVSRGTTLTDFEKIKIFLPRRVRHSGDRFTTCGNFIVECVGTLCCIFERPSEVLKNMSRMHREERNSDGKFVPCLNRRFKTLFVYEKTGPHPTVREPLFIWIRTWFEGDDGLLRVTRHLKMFEQQIIENYHSLGLDCKLFFREGTWSKPERAEFCGVHLLTVNGNTTFYNDKGAWCPDIVRAMTNHPYTTSALAKDSELLPSIAACSYISRALDFAGRVPWVAHIFKSMADEWRRYMNTDDMPDDMQTIKELEMKNGLVTDCVETLFEEYDRRAVEVLKPQIYNPLANASIGYFEDEVLKSITHTEESSVLGYDFAYRSSESDEESFAHLPRSLRMKLRP